MTPLDDDLREAIEQRLADRIAENRDRRDGRRRRLAELSERRTAGLRQRHATKLLRSQETNRKEHTSE